MDLDAIWQVNSDILH